MNMNREGFEDSLQPPLLAIIVPCYNEAEALPQTIERLCDLVKKLVAAGDAKAGSSIYFVDDGSRDSTWQVIKTAAVENSAVRGLRLSRNFGHQAAVLAGLMECDADVFVSIDADLQDDENCIAEMIAKYRDGAEIVYGVRASRATDTAFKRNTAGAYYRLLAALGTKIVVGHADYRLMSRRAVEFFGSFKERNLFLRGLVPMIGLPSATVTYDRKERTAGESKYPLRKMLVFAWEGITSLSTVPLRAVTTMGAFVALGAILLALWVVYQRLFGVGVVPGWASTLLPIYFLGGIQIFCMGVLGEYIGKIYIETKQRPRYLISEAVGGQELSQLRESRQASLVSARRC